MILGIFQLGGEQAGVIVDNNNLFFKEVNSSTITTIEGLKLNKSGVVREFPELEDNPEWKKIAIERLKKHVSKLPNEKERMRYITIELNKFGWTKCFYQKAGFRPQKEL